MKFLTNILDWFTFSSENPDKLSLTLKGGLPFVVALSAYFGLNLGMGDWEKLVEAVVAVVSGVVFIYGFGRKLVNSFK